jgi:putative membrane protein
MGSGSRWEAPARWTIRAYARHVVKRDLVTLVEGLEHLPAFGPTIVVARHYHHLYDAALLIASIDRPVLFLVALDWVGSPAQKWLMEAACRMARWPVLLRPAALDRRTGRAGRAVGPYAPGDAPSYLRRALREAHHLLGEGRLLVIFPEAYPNVDPTFTLKAGPEAWLPFSSIVARIALRAARSVGQHVPIVPAGFDYEPGERRRVTLRFGPAISPAAAGGAAALTRQLEAAVAALSGAAVPQRAHGLVAPTPGCDAAPNGPSPDSRRVQDAAVDSPRSQRDA